MTAIAASYPGYFTVDYGVGVVETEVVAVVDEVVYGRRYLSQEVLQLQREQWDEERPAQLVLFELKDDRRPASQGSADGRYREPTLFKID